MSLLYRQTGETLTRRIAQIHSDRERVDPTVSGYQFVGDSTESSVDAVFVGIMRTPFRVNSMAQRLQKILASSGFGSRRALEQWIRDGEVRVNFELAELGAKVAAGDWVTVRGVHHQVVDRGRAPCRVLMYHKPVGLVCTRDDEQGRQTVFDKLPRLHNSRWVAVGRLDINTSGLLLFTDDGELANRMMHPSSELVRKYAVRVHGEVDDAALETLRTGVQLEDGMAAFDTVTSAGGEGSNHWYNVTLREGRNREVRRLWESQGAVVSRLTRVQYGPVALPRWLSRGKFEMLKGEGLTTLLKALGQEHSETLSLVKKQPPRGRRTAETQPKRRDSRSRRTRKPT